MVDFIGVIVCLALVFAFWMLYSEVSELVDELSEIKYHIGSIAKDINERERRDRER